MEELLTILKSSRFDSYPSISEIAAFRYTNLPSSVDWKIPIGRLSKILLILSSLLKRRISAFFLEVISWQKAINRSSLSLTALTWAHKILPSFFWNRISPTALPSFTTFWKWFPATSILEDSTISIILSFKISSSL